MPYHFRDLLFLRWQMMARLGLDDRGKLGPIMISDQFSGSPEAEVTVTVYVERRNVNVCFCRAQLLSPGIQPCGDLVREETAAQNSKLQFR